MIAHDRKRGSEEESNLQVRRYEGRCSPGSIGAELVWSAGIEPAISSLARTRRQPVDHDHMIGETGGSRTHGVTCASQVPQPGAFGLSATASGMITSLTWAAHEFTDSARDEKRWRQAMGMVQEKGGSVTLSVLTDLLTTLAKNALGL